MHAFITGSRVYGKPRPDSDIDLVIRTDTATAEKLLTLSGGKLPIRFGDLNLIVCTSDDEFAVWRLGTTSLERGMLKEGPYTTEQAKAVLDVLREAVGLTDKSYSGGMK